MTNARNRKRRNAIDAIKNGMTQLEFSFRPPSVGPLSSGGFGVEPKQIEKKCLKLEVTIARKVLPYDLGRHQPKLSSFVNGWL